MYKKYGVFNLVLALLLLLPAAASAQRVDPPQNFKQYEVILFTHANWQSIPQEAALVNSFSSGDLAKLKASSNFIHYTQNEPVYVAGRYWNVPATEFPVIIVAHSAQRGGGYFYKASKDSMPPVSSLFSKISEAYHRDANARKNTELAVNAAVSGEFEQDCPDGYCPPSERQPLLPNAPWNRPDSVDVVEGLFGPDTPIRDSLGYAAWLFGAIIALVFLSVIFFGFVMVVSMIIWVFRK